MHYEGINRRMDEWIPMSRIQPTDILIEEEGEVKRKKKVQEDKKVEVLHENSEHEGMD